MEVLIKVALVLLLLARFFSLLGTLNALKVSLHVVVSCLGRWVEAEANAFQLSLDFSLHDFPSKFVGVNVSHNENGLHGLTEDEEPVVVVKNEICEFF